MSKPIRTCHLSDNQLLAALSVEELERFSRYLVPVTFPPGSVIYAPNEQIANVYFPTDCIVSIIYITESGSSAEIGMVGYEGVVTSALFMGDGTMSNWAVIRGAGSALKMNSQVVRAEFMRGGKFQALLLRYMLAFFTQVSTISACNRLHSVEQQLCCSLLSTHDRTRSNTLVMTHELIANLLGVRRKAVTMAAGHLQEQGLISYTRGTITIFDRQGLERTVCECYRVVKNEYDRLLG